MNEHIRTVTVCGDLLDKTVNVWKKDGTCFLRSDFEEIEDGYEAVLLDGSKFTVKLERIFRTKEYVTARVLESSTIQGFFDSKIGFPVIQNLKDTGNHDADCKENSRFFMCGVLRMCNLISLAKIYANFEYWIFIVQKENENEVGKRVLDAWSKDLGSIVMKVLCL